ncbi:MAG: redoxin family protein [Myxococcales bacterium]
MTRFKRYFPIPYLLVATFALGHMVYHLVRSPELSLAWFGALIAISPLVAFMSSLVLFRRARTTRNSVLVLALALLGTVVSFVDYEGPASWYALLLGLLPSLGYFFWYSRLDRSAPTPIAVGVTLPELALRDADGNAVHASNERHALYMFVRGNWCPLCMAQVREVAAQYRELEARGVDIYVITSQPDSHTRALARRFHVPIRFCIDQGGRLARQLGIEHPGGVPFLIGRYGVDKVLPTVLITEPQRKIIFADMTDNYRIRPEPGTFLAALDARA